MRASRLSLVILLALCVGVLFFVPGGLGLALEHSRIESESARIQFAGALKLSAARQARAARLEAALDSATARHKADVAHLKAKLASVRPRVDSILVAAAAARVDTVKVSVEDMAEVDATLRACSLAEISCANRIAAEQEMRSMAEEEAAAAKAERDAARKLIPTTRQKVAHDGKVVVGTVSVIAIVKAALSLFGR